MNDYYKFLETKKVKSTSSGFDIDADKLNPLLFDFQRDIVQWALYKGRCAIFADCGLGKTIMQLEFAHQVALHTRRKVLIVAPLAVTTQTIQEAGRFGYRLVYAQHDNAIDTIDCDIIITNYERLSGFHPDNFGGIVLDESSILKNFAGKMRNQIIEFSQSIDYRLACTATPAPNDAGELGNHAEFLGIMKRDIMMRRWFSHNAGDVHSVSLKQHGVNDFWGWVASWAVSLRKPSDIGNYSDDGYILPKLIFTPCIVGVDHSRSHDEVDKNGQRSLLLTGKTSATNMHREKRATLKKRMKVASEIAREKASQGEYVVIWVATNSEADYIKKLLPDAVEVRGDEKAEIKRDKLIAFSNGETQILITKQKIASFGLNWQHCNVQIHASITHKFEAFYQAYSRSYRFGQKKPVTCYLVYAESEGSILENVNRKHKLHIQMQHEMVAIMRANGMSLTNKNANPVMYGYNAITRGENWTIYNGDSAIELQNEPDESVDFIIQSPPFKDLFVYSDSIADLGNNASSDKFYEQYEYILRDELRRLKTGAYKAEHCSDLPLRKMDTNHEIGLIDFVGELIKVHQKVGFWFVGIKVVWKDPLIEVTRKKALGLIWSKSFCEKAEQCRQGIADYVLIFQKPIEGQLPPSTEIETTSIPESVIKRCLDLWTNEKLHDEIMVFDFNSSFQKNNLFWISYHLNRLMAGRNLVIRTNDPAKMHIIIDEMKKFNYAEHGYKMVFHSRVALTDGTFLLVFRKWIEQMPDNNHVKHDVKRGEYKYIGNDEPIANSDALYSQLIWQKYASPVWYDLDGLPTSHPDIWFDIDQTNVLNHKIAREKEDEKHICPLQIDLIEKCIALYSKRGDVVSSSFAGVGSELVTAIRMGRKAVGCELKQSYYNVAVKNLLEQEEKIKQPTLFDFADITL